MKCLASQRYRCEQIHNAVDSAANGEREHLRCVARQMLRMILGQEQDPDLI